MSTVAERLEEAHEYLLKLYTSIPILTPSLEKIKTNQAEFVHLNNRLRQLQESISLRQSKVEKIRKQLDSVFTINKAEFEKSYRHEINELKAVENERRACLRQRDSVVTVKYQLEKERATLLEETRQLKKLTESVFDRSKDQVANADFPEELYWQLELREYDVKITDTSRQLTKYNTALSNLARAANLSEAALVAFLGYPDAAYKIWRVEYALKASQKMRLYLRVELSLTNAYQNENMAREACPNIVPPLPTPIKPSTVQSYFEPTSKRKAMQPFNTEIEKGLRGYIAHLRAAHKTAEMLVAQETVRLNSMQAYREAIIPLLARIRRHVFQDSRLNGYQIEGWEDEHGQSLLGTEADILVRGGIHNIGTPTLSQPALASSSLQSVPTLIRPSLDSNSAEDEVEGIMNTRSRERRGFGRVPDIDDSECTMDHHRPNQVNGGRAFLTAGKAPLSTLAPNNVLGSEVLIQVDCERQTKHKAKKEKIRMRSRSRSRHDSEAAVDTNIDGRQAQGANDLSALGLIGMNNSSDNNSRNSNNRAQEDREGQKRMSRGLFGFVRSRRNSGNESEDVVVPTLSIPTVLQFDCNSRSTVDVTSSNTHGTGTMGVNDVPSQQQQQQRGHRRNVPSISVSNHDTAPGSRINQDNQHPLGRSILENGPLIQLPFWSTPASGSGSSSSLQPSTPFSSSRSSPSLSSSMIRPQMMSVDEYVGVGPIIERIDGLMGPEPIDLARSGPLIPSYEEHHRHQAIDPGSLQIMQTSVTYEGLSSLAEQGEGLDNLEELIGPDSGPRRSTTAHQHPANRIRSRSLSPHSFPMIQTISTNATGSSRISGISSSNDNNSINNTNVNTTSRINSTDNAARPWYQHHHYSFSDQSPDDRAGPILNMPPPDYAVQPPRYTA